MTTMGYDLFEDLDLNPNTLREMQNIKQKWHDSIFMEPCFVSFGVQESDRYTFELIEGEYKEDLLELSKMFSNLDDEIKKNTINKFIELCDQNGYHVSFIEEYSAFEMNIQNHSYLLFIRMYYDKRQDRISPIPNRTEQERISELQEALNAEHKQDYKKYELDYTKEYDQPAFTLFYNGIGFAPKGDIHAIKSAQKNGKTFLCTLLISAILKGEYMGITSNLKNPKVLFVDTEQHERNVSLVYRRLCKMTGCDKPNVCILAMRGKDPKEITDAIEQAIIDYLPDVVFIDGIRDISNGINDEEEASRIIRKLMEYSLAFNCSIWNVLHVNPGTDKMRGHLGTELQNKSSDVLQITKDTETYPNIITFKVQQTDARNKDIPPFLFFIDDSDGLAIPAPVRCNKESKSKLEKVFKKALEDKPLRYGELIDKLQEIWPPSSKGKKRSKNTIKNDITMATSEKIICHDDVMGKYRYVGE